MKMQKQNTNQLTSPAAEADRTQKTVIPKVRYHPTIQIQTHGDGAQAKTRTSQTKKTRPAAQRPQTDNKPVQQNKNQAAHKTPLVDPVPAVSPARGRKKSAKKPVQRAAIDPDQLPDRAPPTPEQDPLVDPVPAVSPARGRKQSAKKPVQRAAIDPDQLPDRAPPTPEQDPLVDPVPAVSPARGRKQSAKKPVQRAAIDPDQLPDRAPPTPEQDPLVDPVPAVSPARGRKQSAKKPVQRAAIDPDQLPDRAPPTPEQVPLGLGVQLDSSVVEEVEVLTRGQRNNPDWFAWRKNRITASVAHRIAHCHFVNGKSKSPPMSYLSDITGEGRRFRTRAMSWGINMEAEVVRKYQRMKSTARGRSVLVQECGLFIDAQRPWLAASPDGIVTDSRTGQRLLCLEVKCPYKHKDRRVEDACRDDRAFCLEIQDQDGRRPGGSPVYSLKTSHSYFTQIQCQLAVTGLQQADLVVFTLKEVAIVPVTFDPDMWEETVSKLEVFYRDVVMPRLRAKTQQDTAAAWTPEL